MRRVVVTVATRRATSHVAASARVRLSCFAGDFRARDFGGVLNTMRHQPRCGDRELFAWRGANRRCVDGGAETSRSSGEDDAATSSLSAVNAQRLVW